MGYFIVGFIVNLKASSREIIVSIVVICHIHFKRPYIGNKVFIKYIYHQAKPRMTLFTGSSRVAEKLAFDLGGRIRLEDAGFDWKVLGPDVQEV